jgi:hypothetical protein
VRAFASVVAVIFVVGIVVACGGESGANATETATARHEDALASTYEVLILDQVGTLNSSITRFLDLSNADPATPGWTSMIEEELVLWKSLAAESRNLVAPQRYGEMHTMYLTAMDHFEQAAVDFLIGMAAGDQSLMNAGIQSMLEGVDFITKTRTLLPES